LSVYTNRKSLKRQSQLGTQFDHCLKTTDLDNQDQIFFSF